MYGFESRIDWEVCNCLQLSNTVSFTSGKFDDGGNLPQIPPIKGFTEIKYKTTYYSFGVSGEWALDAK